MEVRTTKKAIIIWCDGNRWYGRNRDRGIPRKLLIDQECTKPRPGGQGGEGTIKKEETSELSHEQEVHGHPGLQLAKTHTCANLIFD